MVGKRVGGWIVDPWIGPPGVSKGSSVQFGGPTWEDMVFEVSGVHRLPLQHTPLILANRGQSCQDSCRGAVHGMRRVEQGRVPRKGPVLKIDQSFQLCANASMSECQHNR